MLFGSSATESKPKRIGRYEVVTRLSEGGMAELFLGYVDGPGGFRKFVALKRILPSLRNDAEFVTMFMDEARISAALSHSNIAQTFEFGEDEEGLFMAMEFIAGQDCGRIVASARERATPLPVGLAARLVRETCLGLHYAHNFKSPSGEHLPVVHRDLAPRNVMVTYDGHVRLIDFGIAKARGRVSRTDASRVKGSASFMSPEQIRGEPLNGQTDLFSAGAVLYELLTNERAFRATEDVATMYQVLHSNPKPPHEQNPEVPEALSAVVLKALSKTQPERFQNGREMAAAIDEACPEMFDEVQVSRWMVERFENAVGRTRLLLQKIPGSSPNQPVLDDYPTFPGSRTRADRSYESDSQITNSRQVTEDNTGIMAPKFGVGRTVMIVDDMRGGRILVAGLLKRAGYEVISVGSGEEALATLEAKAPDLIITDVSMTGIDGFTLCTRLRERTSTRSVPVLFLSSACSIDERTKGLSVGGDDFIRKPFDGTDLLARVRLHLRRNLAQDRVNA